MSHNDSVKQKSVLWTIFPVAIALTLLFVYRNRSAVHEYDRLDGSVKRVEQKMEATPVHHSIDSTHVVPHAPDSTHAPAAH